jgi:hypothetical protein
MPDADPARHRRRGGAAAGSASSSSTFCSARKTTARLRRVRTDVRDWRAHDQRVPVASARFSTQPIVPPASRTLIHASTGTITSSGNVAARGRTSGFDRADGAS